MGGACVCVCVCVHPVGGGRRAMGVESRVARCWEA